MLPLDKPKTANYEKNNYTIMGPCIFPALQYYYKSLIST